jgi:hypothetical protein
MKTLETLTQEKEIILKWMLNERHPSDYVIWNDAAEASSKKWSNKQNELKVIEEAIKTFTN